MTKKDQDNLAKLYLENINNYNPDENFFSIVIDNVLESIQHWKNTGENIDDIIFHMQDAIDYFNKGK